MGRQRIHRHRLYPGDPAPPREPPVREPGPYLVPVAGAAGSVARHPDEPAGRRDLGRCVLLLLPDRTPHPCPAPGSRAGGAGRRGDRGAGRGHGIHRVEPEHRQREGVYGVAAGRGRGQLAGASRARPWAGPAEGPAAAGRRGVPHGPRIDQSPDVGAPGRCGRCVRPSGPAGDPRAAPFPVALRPGRCRRPVLQLLPAHPRRSASRHQRGGSALRRLRRDGCGDLHQREGRMSGTGFVAATRPVRQAARDDAHGPHHAPGSQLLPVLRLAVGKGDGSGRAGQPQAPPLHAAVPRAGGRGPRLGVARRPEHRGVPGCPCRDPVPRARLLSELPLRVLGGAGRDPHERPRSAGTRLLLPAGLRALGLDGGAGSGVGMAVAWRPAGERPQGRARARGGRPAVFPEPELGQPRWRLRRAELCV